jgi:hypothetical protein
MNLNQSCVFDAFLITSFPNVFQASYLLPLKLTLSAYETKFMRTQT